MIVYILLALVLVFSALIISEHLYQYYGNKKSEYTMYLLIVFNIIMVCWFSIEFKGWYRG